MESRLGGDVASAFVLGIIVVFSPFLYNSSATGDGFWLPAVLWGTVALLLIWALAKTKYLPKPNSFLFCLVAFFVWQLIRIIGVKIDLEHCTRALLWFPLFLIVMICCREQCTRRILLGSISLSCFVQAGYSMLQWGGYLPSYHLAFPITGSFLNPGPLGGYLAIGAIISLGMFLYVAPSAVKYVLISIFFLISGICMLTASRAAWIALAIGALFLLRKNDCRRTVWPLFIIGLLASFFLYWIRVDSANGRMLIWKVCAIIAKNHLWIGEGTGRFSSVYMNAQAVYFSSGNATEAESMLAADSQYAFNAMIHILCEYGLIGCGFIIIAMIFFLRNEMSSSNFEQRTAQAGLIGWCVFSLFSYPEDVLSLSVLLPILLGIAMTVPNSIFSVTLGVRMLMVGGIVALTSFFYIYVQRLYQISEAIRSNLFSNHCNAERFIETHKSWFHNELNLMNLYANGFYIRGLYEEVIPWLAISCQLQPTGEKYIRLGLCYWDIGMNNAADSCFMKAHYMLPSHARPLYYRFRMHQEFENQAQALEYANQLLRLSAKIENEEVQKMKQDALTFTDIYSIEN